MGSRKRGYTDEKYNERGLSTALNRTTKVHKKRDSGDMQKSQQLVLSQNLFCGLEIWVRPHRSEGVAMTRVGSRETHTTANETLEAIYRKCLSLTHLKSLSSGAGGRDYGCHSILLLPQW